MAWARDTAVSVATALIRGVDVKGSWRPSPTPGTYWLSYVVSASDPLLAGHPPVVQLQLVDSRYVPLARACPTMWWGGRAVGFHTVPLWVC